MRRLFSAFAILLFSYSCLRGDDSPRARTNYINVFQQGFVLESLSGYGFSGTAFSPVFNIGSGNPASMANFNQFCVGFSNQVNTKIESFGIADATFQRVNNLIPQSGGMVYSIHNFSVGAGFSQKYSGEIRIENIGVSEPSNYDGADYYVTAILKNTIYSVSSLASYQFGNLLSKADWFSFGVQMNVNLLRNRESISSLTGKLNDDAVNWKFGFGYTYHHQSIEKLQLGITYESKIKFSGYYEYNHPTLNILPPNAIALDQIPSTLTYPAKLKFGFLFEPISKLGLYNDFIYNFWNDIYPNNKNKLDISGGFVFRASAGLTASAGYYALGSYAPDVNRSGVNINDAVFVSGGLVFTLKQFNLHLVFADSHLFSGERSKQTIGKIGIAFNL